MRRHEHFPPLQVPEPKDPPTFVRELPSRPARVLFDLGNFASRRLELGPGARVYAAHWMGGNTWTLYEVPSGRELVVVVVNKPTDDDKLETRYELDKASGKWKGRIL